ncbi:MAG: DUF1080 domain-containing protein [Tannerella sp.]|jgi:hypothetical protein|nr:DUF1080 domain-containing protein [Tannerella sp.]
MKRINFLWMAFLSTTLLVNAQDVRKEFYGMWTLDIEDGSVGWLGVNEDKGFLDADLLWQGGSVEPVAGVYFTDEHTLVVIRTGQARRSDDRRHVVNQTYTFERTGDKLTGTLVRPSGDGMNIVTRKFTGWRLPDPGQAPDLSKVKYGAPVKLFNGKDLSGWRLINPNQASAFKVINGELVNDPVQPEGQHISFGNLRTDAEYEDFKLTLEVNVPAGSNSGVYLRGIYEVQVVDSYGKALDPHNMGALYSRITPSEAAEKPAGEWQTMEMILCNRHLTVVLNGKKIIDNKPVYGPTGGAMHADVCIPGPIYLQGDHGKVSYRNIVLTPILK